MSGDEFLDQRAPFLDNHKDRFQPQNPRQGVGQVAFQVQEINPPGQTSHAADSRNQDAQLAVGLKRIEIAQFDAGGGSLAQFDAWGGSLAAT